MNFFKVFFSSCLGAFVALACFAAVVFIVLAGLGTETPVLVEPNSILTLKLNYPITELEVEDPVANILPEAAENSLGLLQIKNTIAKAKTDDNIIGIYIPSGSVGGGISTVREIRESLLDFRKSGKWVVVYDDNFSEGGYYLATAADTIFLNPGGRVELNGLATEVMFFKKLFDKLDIKPQVFRVGEFKSAVEPFLRDNLSDENKLQLNSLLHSIYDTMLTDMAIGRNMELKEIKTIATKMLVRNAAQAKALKIVDGLHYEDEVLDFLKTKSGRSKTEKLNTISYRDYKQAAGGGRVSKNEIAVIVADGEILGGNSDAGIVGSKTIVDALRKARESKRVKAVVLRINSPGGSAQASDDMWREVTLLAKEKTIIASMSNVAASGGYYLAMGCDSIVAQPTTITGSIGVFSVLFDMSKFLDNKVGITSQEVKTGEIGELITFTRSLNETEKAIWQKQTDEIYETFTGKAAAGRHMAVDELKKIASGRVWTGAQAKQNGLVDVLGGFNDAVKLAAEAEDLGSDYRLRYYPKSKTLFEKIFDVESTSNTDSRITQALGGEQAILYKQYQKLKRMEGIQARLPWEIELN